MWKVSTKQVSSLLAYLYRLHVLGIEIEVNSYGFLIISRHDFQSMLKYQEINKVQHCTHNHKFMLTL